MIENGKVPNELLQQKIFNQICYTRPEVVVSPDIGEDCGVLEFENDEQIVLSTDPITGATHEIGKLAVHISSNDVCSAGAEPVGILVTLLLPTGTTAQDIEMIMKDIHETAEKNHIAIVGGHSEVTDAVTRPVVSTTVIGKVKKGNLICTKGAKIGDAVILTKWAGIEGTAILAHQLEQELTSILTKEELEQAKLLTSELSVRKESGVVKKVVIHSMHDVTEGGVFGGCYEIAACAGLGIEIDKNSVPLLSITKKICSYLAISPYKLISSGCMLLTTPQPDKCICELKKSGIMATCIGKITSDEKYIVEEGKKQILSPPESDELYKGLKKGKNLSS